MLRAHVERKVDYSSISLDEPRELALERLILEDIDRSITRDLLSKKALLFAGGLSSSHPSDNGLNVSSKYRELAFDTYDNLRYVSCPWLGEPDEADRGKINKGQAEELLGKWQDTFGSLEDEAVQKELAEYEDYVKTKGAEDYLNMRRVFKNEQ